MKKSIRMRGGSGLGDAMYIRPIAEYFVRCGKRVTVCSDFPGVFDGSDVRVVPFDRFNIDVLAHYTQGKRDSTTNQWQDVCRSAGVEEMPLTFSWPVKNKELVERLRTDAAGRRLVLVHGGRAPMARVDGFGKELLPRQEAFDATLSALENCFTVRIGKGCDIYRLNADVDMSNVTTVQDLLDLGVSCDAIVGQCSFAIPLAEVFNKPLMTVWAAHGMQYNMHPYIQQITPKKVLSKPTSHFVVDDWDAEKILTAVRVWAMVWSESDLKCAF